MKYAVKSPQREQKVNVKEPKHIIPEGKGGYLLVETMIAMAIFAVGFLAQSIVGAISAWLPEGLEVFDPSRSIIVSLALWAIGVAAITLIFRVLPDAVVSWHTAVVGGTITALLVALGSSLIGLYVSNYAASSISGAIGSVLAFLLWVYLETQIVLGGAVLTRILQDRRDGMAASAD